MKGGMNGRPPKPLQFRAKEGNPGKRRLPKQAPLTPGIPDAPDDLTGFALEFWKRNGAHLTAMGVLAKQDRDALEFGARSYGEWRECLALVEREGRTVTTGTAYGESIKAHPAVAQAADASRRVMAFLQNYGLTAISRAKVAPLEGGSDAAEADFA